MKRPRAATRATASGKATAFAHTRAEYSPRLCPAIASGARPPASIHTRHTATPAASIAGWVHSVAFSRSSGPSWHTRQRS